MKNNENYKAAPGMEPVYKINPTEVKDIHLSLGNSKIGNMINWSTLPGNEEHMLIAKGRLITDIVGTCSINCQGCFKNCYARKSVLKHHNSVACNWAENTIMIRDKKDECFQKIDEEIRKLNREFCEGRSPEPKYDIFRINVSGEISDSEELERWNNLAYLHPEIKFGTYTKNSTALIEFFKKNKDSAPNFTINVSEWHGVMKDTIETLHKIGSVFNVFEYDDSNRAKNDLSEDEKVRLSKLPHCVAVGPTAANRHPINPKTGKAWHCHECKGCYTKTGTHRCVYSH